ncbi:MAG: hypothetical protein V1918_03510 [Planctomycetota bacterium]
MDLSVFFDAVENHPELRGVSIAMGDPEHEGELCIEHVPSKLVTAIPAGAVEKADWPVLEEVLTGKREPHVLYHMTRVVGYYSRVENWNKSKLGELADRRAGRYAVKMRR